MFMIRILYRWICATQIRLFGVLLLI